MPLPATIVVESAENAMQLIHVSGQAFCHRFLPVATSQRIRSLLG